ncbi:MFS transporter [Peribacillus cavernae]|uniref:MFS transporter n=1 Tax=Peribacillus cavernae TaxID=1674310 RepID=A0A3S0VQ19_9BACI|nr:MFS transporter [Peribacillus cavernae]MDQ0217290.1 FSR family fosmidomycin resistance protein-like MFS transporter [Peribacillus cavernae]RUQ30244.1 MFS transporter [Peribacillus cavernae]
MASTAQAAKNVTAAHTTAYNVLFIIGICHLLNDTLQSVVPAMFPILEKTMSLSYTQLGMVAFALNIVSSIMQPVVGWYTDKKPIPYALPLGLTSTLAGIVLLALSPTYSVVILSVLLIGIGSAVFHPEGSRVAFMAGGPKRGLSQSIYQVGGNTGQALAPLITAVVLVPFGQKGALWFAPVAFAAVLLLVYIARWYTDRLVYFQPKKAKANRNGQTANRKKIGMALFFILFIIFARSWYISCMTNFYAFYLIGQYSFSIKTAQLYLFAFLAAGALGTFFGGPLADRFGRKKVILLSLVGSAPITILLPFVSPAAAFILLLVSGFIIMTSFSVTVVYAQELVPGKVGTMAGLTVGLAFGMGAIGSVALGSLADLIGINSTIKMVGLLPLLGLMSFFLPSDETLRKWYPKET